jgi:hypothetical protein
MKKIFLVAVASLFLFACDKDDIITPPPPPDPPEMIYLDLQNREVKFRQPQRLDINGDDINDFTFGVIHVGDASLRRDRYLFYAGAAFYSFLPIDNIEESPIMSKGDKVGSISPLGYQWYNGSLTVLAEKIVPETGNYYWAGPWLNVFRQFLAIQVEKNGKRYFGWIELSMNQTHEKVILNKAALSKEAGRDVAAGF